MNKQICIHGHFYQPPRENPWLDEVELQDSAYPYHDWNERITAECYAPNTASRVFDNEGRIKNIVNNYSSISFNFGPTLLSWMKRHKPDVYDSIINADIESRKRFSGHGCAIAQVYNHIIMPLANLRDKRTQIIWGIKDFQFHYKRFPEGMWLAETAVDLESLDIMAELGIKFTILAPHQAHMVKAIDSDEWLDVSGQKIDQKTPYILKLPSNRTITIFFYDGPVSSDISFQDTLENGENFANRLLNSFSDSDQDQILTIATDGETYGHHHKYGEMALTYCINHIESNNLAKITIPGEYLEQHTPQHEVIIFENSSWSCSHGIERWRSDCGCKTGANDSWNQKWRAPLREAMDWLSATLIPFYEKEISAFTTDPWKIRNDYIEIIHDRSKKNINDFISRNCVRELTLNEKIRFLKLLEIQRHTQLMYTSCGWFFDEISRIEPKQIMCYAACAMQMAKEISGINYESNFLKIIEKATSNEIEFENGKSVYNIFIKPSITDLLRAGAHYAVSSLFKEHSDKIDYYCYTAESEIYDLKEAGIQRLAVGKAKISSHITWDETNISFAILHLGDHNIIGGVQCFLENTQFHEMKKEIDDAFMRSNITNVISLIKKHFGKNDYSLWHIFKDDQRNILNSLIKSAVKEREASFKHSFNQYYPIMQVMKEMSIPLPKAFQITTEFTLNTDIANLLSDKNIDLGKLQNLIDEIKRWSIDIDKKTVNFIATNKINSLLSEFLEKTNDLKLLKNISEMMSTLKPLSLDLQLWEAQNIYFSIIKTSYSKMSRESKKGNNIAKEWLELFNNVGTYLQIKSPE
jgi:alpha-amylase/alpha-mannosidase (GH57 family)